MIRTEQLCLRIGTFALQQACIKIVNGQYFVLLGPPGSGKTVFLECLCGLKRIDSGKIFIDDRDVTHLEPRARNIGYVPQDYALFPHLSVERNIAFGLFARRYHRKDVASRMTEITELLGIGHLMPRRIDGLSGGEKQRIALARALVLRPKVLLLDEPVCALDEATRQDICGQLLRIQRQLGLTTIHVSHNLKEAFSVADCAAILYKGVIQQVGSLDELLRRPNTEFVARFMRCENIYSGKLISTGTDCSIARINGGIELQVANQVQPGGSEIKLAIRPEDVLVLPRRHHNHKCENQFAVNLVRWRDCGDYMRAELDGPLNVVAHVTHATFVTLKTEGDQGLNVALPLNSIHVIRQ